MKNTRSFTNNTDALGYILMEHLDNEMRESLEDVPVYYTNNAIDEVDEETASAKTLAEACIESVKKRKKILTRLNGNCRKRTTKALINIMQKLHERYKDVDGLGKGVDRALLFDGIAVAATGREILWARQYESSILHSMTLWIIDRIRRNPESLKKLYEYAEYYRETAEQVLGKIISRTDGFPVFVGTRDVDAKLALYVFQILCGRYSDIIHKYPEEDPDNYNNLYNSAIAALPDSRKQLKDSLKGEEYKRVLDLVPAEDIARVKELYNKTFYKKMDELCLPMAENNKACREATAEYNEAVTNVRAVLDDLDEKHKKYGKIRKSTRDIKESDYYNPLINKPKEVQLQEYMASRRNLAEEAGDLLPEKKKQALNTIRLGRMTKKRREEIYLKRYRAIDKAILNRWTLIHPRRGKKATEEDCSNLETTYEVNPYDLIAGMFFSFEDGEDEPWTYVLNLYTVLDSLEALPWQRGLEDETKETAGILAGFIRNDDSEDTTGTTDTESTENTTGTADSEDIAGTAGTTDTSGTTAEADHQQANQENEEGFDESWLYTTIAYDKENDEKYTLGQLLFRYVGICVPMELSYATEARKKLLEMGLEAEKAGMLALMAQIEHDQGKKKLAEKKYKQDEKEEEEDPEEEGSEEGSEQEALLKKEIESLKKSLYEASKKARNLEKKVETLQNDNELDRQELGELREAVFNVQTGLNEEEAPEDVKEIELPYEVKNETIIFGGHSSWRNKIKDMLYGNVRFIDKELALHFDTRMIQTAQSVWIQINAISHPAMYRIVNAAKLMKKKVHYFTYNSAAIGAYQVAEKDV